MAKEQLGPRIAALYELQSAHLDPKLRSLGVSWASFQLLAAVYGAEAGDTQNRIADRLGIKPATMSEAVFNHVQKGLLEQTTNGSDRRAKALRLTPKGRKLVESIQEGLGEAEAALAKGFSVSETRELAAVFDRMLKNLEENLKKSATSRDK